MGNVEDLVKRDQSKFSDRKRVSCKKTIRLCYLNKLSAKEILKCGNLFVVRTFI